MKKEEFVRYISENFDCSIEAAEAVITIFSESISLAFSEGQTVELENLGLFKTRTVVPRRKSPTSLSPLQSKRYPYFIPAPDLKIACN